MGNSSGGSIGFGLTYRRDLVEYINGRATPSNIWSYSADKIAPPVKVLKSEARIPEIFAGDGDRYVSGQRAEGGGYPRISWKPGQSTYSTDIRGWEMVIDNIEDTENMEIFPLQKIHSEILQDTDRVFKEFSVATAIQTAANYAATNKKEITLAANNWLTGDNLRTDVVDMAASSTLYTEKGLELEDLSLGLPIDFIRLYRKIDAVVDELKYTKVPSLYTANEIVTMLAAFIGVKEVIPLAGRINTNYFRSNAPAFSRIYSSDKAFLANLSSGGSSWDDSFARQPFYTKPLKGKKEFIETYAETKYDQMVTRYKAYSGFTFNYDNGIYFDGLQSTGT